MISISTGDPRSKSAISAETSLHATSAVTVKHIRIMSLIVTGPIVPETLGPRLEQELVPIPAPTLVPIQVQTLVQAPATALGILLRIPRIFAALSAVS